MLSTAPPLLIPTSSIVNCFSPNNILRHKLSLQDESNRPRYFTVDDLRSAIDDAEAMKIVYELIKNEGLNLGTSSGINIAGAIKLAKEIGPGKIIVTILCDRSDRYQSKLFNKKLLNEKKIPIPNWL